LAEDHKAMSMSCNNTATTASHIDEEELMACIRTLVIGSTHSDTDNGDEEGMEVLPYDAKNEYQALIRQVEEKLTLFLEDQVRMSPSDYKDKYDGPSLNNDKIVLPIHKAHAYPCQDTHKTLPSPPKDWPQRYVLLVLDIAVCYCCTGQYNTVIFITCCENLSDSSFSILCFIFWNAVLALAPTQKKSRHAPAHAAYIDQNPWDSLCLGPRLSTFLGLLCWLYFARQYRSGSHGQITRGRF
jgi:hypothetical protein